MDSILQSGIDQILWLQANGSPSLESFFRVVTDFGGRHYLFMVPLVIWSIDHRTGTRVIFWMSLTLLINSLVKDAIAQPRPFQMDARIVSDGELGYGLPSGHAQLVVIFWGLLAAKVSKPWFWALAVAIMLTMALSRVYLGVHFPTDVYGGLLLGAVTLYLAIRHQGRIESWLASRPQKLQLSMIVCASLFVVLLNGTSFESSLMVGCAGFVFGSGVGVIAMGPHASFTGRGPAWQRVLRYFAGTLLLLVMVSVGTKIVSSADDGVAKDLLIYATLAAMGAWLTGGAPRLFALLRLGDSVPTRESVAN